VSERVGHGCGRADVVPRVRHRDRPCTATLEAGAGLTCTRLAR
jgi:hypothetical protein